MSDWPASLQLLRFYPKRGGSACAGWLAARPLPRWSRSFLLGSFARHYRIDLSAAQYPLEDYPSLQAFFTRRLKPGLRPQADLVPGALNSPVDGQIVACGRIEKGMAIQAKGLPYRIEELLKHDPQPGRFEGGYYLTLYLAPKDYHRIHVPLAGKVASVGRVEGELWPVNEEGVAHVPRLYERNRRATWLAKGTGPDEGLEVALVLVGATHVGGVVLEERWREGRDLPRDGGFQVKDLPCLPGEDLGTFQFGSTVILLVAGPKGRDWRPVRTEGAIQVGERLGMFP
ncbi:MAG TPA: archaetidylserine decarboxylase [Holophaga sp.]|nr:archaetidylserine decarboxylase [Holophaga sp.]HPS68622.1 archaetidylserine decarboxylase [Holophaga sp.]